MRRFVIGFGVVSLLAGCTAYLEGGLQAGATGDDHAPSIEGESNDDGTPAAGADSGSQVPGEDDGAAGQGADAGAEPDADPGPPFSFFVTSLAAMRELSGSQDGFGGDLGGLAGADQICQQIAAGVGAGHKTWRAFLSVTSGPEGGPVHAIERIGEGPWYDALGRLVSQNIAGLLNDRPDGDPQIVEDLPDEYGRGLRQDGDNHDVMTGSDAEGRLANSDPSSTCSDWTSAVGPGTEDRVNCGHSWPRSGPSGPGGGGAANWISAHRLRGCSPGVNLVQNGAGTGDCVGCSGGYGGIYCFALTP
jgi:hypothetical protein